MVLDNVSLENFCDGTVRRELLPKKIKFKGISFENAYQRFQNFVLQHSPVQSTENGQGFVETSSQNSGNNSLLTSVISRLGPLVGILPTSDERAYNIKSRAIKLKNAMLKNVKDNYATARALLNGVPEDTTVQENQEQQFFTLKPEEIKYAVDQNFAQQEESVQAPESEDQKRVYKNGQLSAKVDKYKINDSTSAEISPKFATTSITAEEKRATGAPNLTIDLGSDATVSSESTFQYAKPEQTAKETTKREMPMVVPERGSETVIKSDIVAPTEEDGRTETFIFRTEEEKPRHGLSFDLTTATGPDLVKVLETAQTPEDIKAIIERTKKLQQQMEEEKEVAAQLQETAEQKAQERLEAVEALMKYQAGIEQQIAEIQAMKDETYQEITAADAVIQELQSVLPQEGSIPGPKKGAK